MWVRLRVANRGKCEKKTGKDSPSQREPQEKFLKFKTQAEGKGCVVNVVHSVCVAVNCALPITILSPRDKEHQNKELDTPFQIPDLPCHKITQSLWAHARDLKGKKIKRKSSLKGFDDSKATQRQF
jgi:hypothetical protein